jgi:DNA repair exonuclease SbcCD ATPase subunit
MINIKNKSKIKIYWEDEPLNFSNEKEKNIIEQFSKKYGVDKHRIKLEKRNKLINNKNTDEINSDSNSIENINNINVQRELFIEYLKKIKKTDLYESILDIDNDVNNKLNYESIENIRNKNWEILEIEWDNFLSFGNGNYVNYEKLNGVNLVNSNPPNYGGKTVFSVDLLLFLFFNTTTRTKTIPDFFNKFTSYDNVKVKGKILIDGEIFFIERIISRKRKRNGIDFSYATDVNYYKINSDGEIESLKGEERIKTDKIISESIGDYDDFLLTIITTSDNLDSLILTKPTERSKIFYRFMGLELLEKKEIIAREIKNNWSKTLKSNIYNSETLKNENLTYEDEIIIKKGEILIVDETLNKKDSEIITLQNEKEYLLSIKNNIDPELEKINYENLEIEIKKLYNEAILLKEKHDELKVFIEKNDFEYDTEFYENLLLEEKELIKNITRLTVEKENLDKEIRKILDNKDCPVCKRPYESEHNHEKDIEQKKSEIKNISTKIDASQKQLNQKKIEINSQKEMKIKYDDINRKKLIYDKCEVDMENLKLNYNNKKEFKKRYFSNKENIDKNKKIDNKIIIINNKIDEIKSDIRILINSKNELSFEINKINDKIKNNDDIIISISKEEEERKKYMIYIDMIGKNGIGKLILKKLIPSINNEVNRLLSDTAPFEIDVLINENNELDFNIIKVIDDTTIISPVSSGSGYEKTVSSLALRCVLSRYSTLPKPSMIILDEVFGKVANENLENVGNFIRKLNDLYKSIILITHNEIMKDYADNILTINKDKHISKLIFK